MTKVITTCLLGAGIMTAAATLPQSQAHEGHDGHDHGTTQQTEPQVPSNRVIETPPPNSPGSSTRNQLQQPKRNWSDAADRRPELFSPGAEGGDSRPFPSTAPETFRRDIGNDYYPESRSPDDFSHGRSVPPTGDFACPLGRRDAYLSDYPSFHGFTERSTPDGWCPYEVQSLDSSHHVRPRDSAAKSSYDLGRYQYGNQLSGEYDCPLAGRGFREF